MSEAGYIPNTKQLEILRLFYRFRFLTSTHIASILNLPITKINQRLKILSEHDYIDRHYTKQYKIDRRPAEYYLLNDGVAALKQYMSDKCDSKVLHSIYNDKITKPKPIAQYLRVCTIYCYLKDRYGDDNLKFFTKSQIRSYTYFPRRRPEAFIRLDVDGEQKEFFLEVIDPNKPFFDYVGKVRRYIEYSDDGTWREKTGRKLPTILFIGDSVGTEIRIQKQAGRFIKKHYDDEPKVYTTNIEKLKTIAPNYDRVWRNVEEAGKVVGLDSM
jgi:DNA-binding MarR family transcriptional regulator